MVLNEVLLVKLVNISFFLLSSFISRKRKSTGGTEREGKRMLSRLCAANAEPDVGLDLMTLKVVRLNNSATQAPHKLVNISEWEMQGLFSHYF